MAVIDSLTFSITRTSHPAGHICSIDYSYYLRIDEDEFDHNDTFNVSVAIYGDDLFRDKQVGETAYDTHVINVKETMPVKRSFGVDCDVLDEAVGEDKVFIKIFAVTNEGRVLTARSETIKDWF